FGGNPDDVTIFGESAGANSVATLLAVPAAKGLFRKAIAQSGAGAWVSTRERAAMVAERTIATLGVRPGDADALFNLSTEQIFAAQPKLTDEIDRGIAALPWQPVVDGNALT